jgi:hypothetical protein
MFQNRHSLPLTRLGVRHRPTQTTSIGLLARRISQISDCLACNSSRSLLDSAGWVTMVSAVRASLWKGRGRMPRQPQVARSRDRRDTAGVEGSLMRAALLLVVLFATSCAGGATAPITSSGAAQVRVPNVVGLGMADAFLRLGRAHLCVGKIRARPRRSGRPLVLRQNPSAGQLVHKHAKVGLDFGVPKGKSIGWAERRCGPSRP